MGDLLLQDLTRMAAFFKWLGTVEGRSVRYPLIGLSLFGIFVALMPKGSGKIGHTAYDDGWVVVRPCGPIMCPSTLPGAPSHVCGEYLLKRDQQGHYWRTNSIFRDEIDKDSIDLMCPLPK